MVTGGRCRRSSGWYLRTGPRPSTAGDVPRRRRWCGGPFSNTREDARMAPPGQARRRAWPVTCHAGINDPAIAPLRRRSAGCTDDLDNLQGLCKPCHSRKTARETGAGPGAADGRPPGGRGTKSPQPAKERPVRSSRFYGRELESFFRAGFFQTVRWERKVCAAPILGRTLPW